MLVLLSAIRFAIGGDGAEAACQWQPVEGHKKRLFISAPKDLPINRNCLQVGRLRRLGLLETSFTSSKLRAIKFMLIWPSAAGGFCRRRRQRSTCQRQEGQATLATLELANSVCTFCLQTRCRFDVETRRTRRLGTNLEKYLPLTLALGAKTC